MRYLLIVVGLLGMFMGVNSVFSDFPLPPGSGNILGPGLLVAGAVFFALGSAACDIVAAIEQSRPPHKPAQKPGE